MPSFPRTPFFATGALPPLRSGQVFLDEAEHFRQNRSASVATLRELFAFGPECRSRSLRNQRSPSPESSTLEQIREARPSKEFDARFATENFAPNEMQNSSRWYQQMFDEAKAHVAQH